MNPSITQETFKLLIAGEEQRLQKFKDYIKTIRGDPKRPLADLLYEVELIANWELYTDFVIMGLISVVKSLCFINEEILEPTKLKEAERFLLADDLKFLKKYIKQRNALFQPMKELLQKKNIANNDDILRLVLYDEDKCNLPVEKNYFFEMYKFLTFV